MERAIRERFSRRSLGPRSSVLRALSRSTYNTYKSVRHNFFDILVRRSRGSSSSSSFNNPCFRPEKVSAGRRQGVARYSQFLANYRLNRNNIFVGGTKFPKKKLRRLRIVNSNLHPIYARLFHDERSDTIHFPCPSRRECFFISFFFVISLF